MMIPNPMRMIVKMMMIKTKTKNIFINEKILNLYFIKKIYHDKKHYILIKIQKNMHNKIYN